MFSSVLCTALHHAGGNASFCAGRLSASLEPQAIWDALLSAESAAVRVPPVEPAHYPWGTFPYAYYYAEMAGVRITPTLTNTERAAMARDAERPDMDPTERASAIDWDCMPDDDYPGSLAASGLPGGAG